MMCVQCIGVVDTWYLGVVSFFEEKIHEVCGEDVNQMAATYNKKLGCFLTSTCCYNKLKFK